MTGNRKKDFENIVTCWFIIFVITGALIYFGIDGKVKMRTGIIGIVLILGLLLLGIWGIVSYRNKYLTEYYQRNFKEKQQIKKREKKFRQKNSGRAIFRICKSYVLDAIFTKSFVVGIMFGGISLMYKLGEIPVLSGEIDIVECVGVIIAVSVGSGVIYFLYSIISDTSINRLKEEIKRSGYNIQKIIDDFERGSKYEVLDGFLNIGVDYVILFHREVSFVGGIKDIKRVVKEEQKLKYSVPMGQTAEMDIYFVLLHTERQLIRIKCLDEAAADSIVEDFALHGIYDIN